MALVTKGSIEIDGKRVPCTSWSIKGGPSKEAKFAVFGQPLGFIETPAPYEIEFSFLQEKGKPLIDFKNLPDGFTLIRNFVGGARHQFLNNTVSNAEEEDGDDAGNYTYKVSMLSFEKVEQ